MGKIDRWGERDRQEVDRQMGRELEISGGIHLFQLVTVPWLGNSGGWGSWGRGRGEEK